MNPANIVINDIQPNHLPSLPLVRRSQLPKCAGVYFVIDGDGVVQYIGRSKNLRSRWVAHHKLAEIREMTGAKVSWLEISDEDLLPSIEAALIQWFSPPLNREGEGRFQDTGLGTTNQQQPISTKYPPEVDRVLRGMSDRSDFIRKAVIKELIAQGKLDKDWLGET
ncbi:hypothetical protein A6S26_05360 [Nostoc sp. ATCC 43529]|nr:hypothetical protein A6S26_05360 [Nostoc sp. ATCC 43529]